MTRYLLRCSVESAEGSQIYYVDASNEEEAIAKYNAGDAEFYAEEIEVQDLSKPEVIGTTDDDDTGDNPLAKSTQASQSSQQEREDAARYRELRQVWDDEDGEILLENLLNLHSAEDLDEHIDAAIAARAQEKA